MKKVIFTLCVTASGIAAYSQATKALYVDGANQAMICDFNPSNSTASGYRNAGTVLTSPTDFIYDSKNGTAIFQNNMNGLVFYKIENGQFTPRNFSNTVMAPAYMPADQKIVAFNVQKEFNGYGNNEDNLFFSTIDSKTGLTKNLIKFSDVSFNNVSAPFYGKVMVDDRFKQTKAEKDVAISKPLYIADKGLYIILMRDVTGTNRLYKIRVNSPNAAVASNRCDYNIIDMASMGGTDVVKALYFKKVGNAYYELKVGDFNIVTNTMSNESVIKSFSATDKLIVNNGSIKFNKDQTELFVSQFNGGYTNIYSIDLASNEFMPAKTNTVQGNIQFDFGFSESAYKPLTYSSVFKLYPNPSTGTFTFMNQTGIIPNSITVFNNVGQVVKSIKMEDAISQLEIDLSGMSAGIYHVKVDMPGEDFIGKVVIAK